MPSMITIALSQDKPSAIGRADEARAGPPLDAPAEVLDVVLSPALFSVAPSVALLSVALAPALLSAVVVAVVAGAETLCVAPLTTTNPPEEAKETVAPSAVITPPRVRVAPSTTKPDAWSAV